MSGKIPVVANGTPVVEYEFFTDVLSYFSNSLYKYKKIRSPNLYTVTEIPVAATGFFFSVILHNNIKAMFREKIFISLSKWIVLVWSHFLSSLSVRVLSVSFFRLFAYYLKLRNNFTFFEQKMNTPIRKESSMGQSSISQLFPTRY